MPGYADVFANSTLILMDRYVHFAIHHSPFNRPTKTRRKCSNLPKTSATET